MGCAVHGSCLPTKTTPGLHSCLDCSDWAPQGRSVLFTAGIGDALALDSFTTPETREQIEEMVLACPAADAVQQLFQSIPTYPNLRAFRLLPTGGRSYYSLAAVEEAHGALPGVEDWSITARFPACTRYAGSSFLQHTLCRARRIGRSYAIVVPHSSWGGWQGRSFDAADWSACLSVLERLDLLGVVLHRGEDRVEPHPQLLDLTNQCSLLENIELLKGAEGYLGIDSGLSVLAAKLFPRSRLAVKSVWGHCYANAHTYYAPWSEFPFLQRTLEVSAWK